MRVDPVTAASQVVHGGRTFVLCSPECARTFATRSTPTGGAPWT
jgi:YHS domain-containing protein